MCINSETAASRLPKIAVAIPICELKLVALFVCLANVGILFESTSHGKKLLAVT